MARLGSSKVGAPFRLLRALWRYRGMLVEHSERYQTDLAVAVRSAIEANVAGSAGLASYRFALRLLRIAIVASVVMVALVAFAAWQVSPWLALLGLPPLVLAALLLWWRLSIGRPIDWLDEHDDPSRTISAAELPERLRQLARDARHAANLPDRLGEELDALARETERTVPGAATARTDGPFVS